VFTATFASVAAIAIARADKLYETANHRYVVPGQLRLKAKAARRPLPTRTFADRIKTDGGTLAASRQFLLAFVALTLAASSSGCAFGARHVLLTYPPRSSVSESGVAHAESTKASVHLPIILVRFNDLRQDRAAIGTVRNALGMRTAAVLADNDVADWVTDAVKLELEGAGYQVTQTEATGALVGARVLSGDVLTVFGDAYFTYRGNVSFMARVTSGGNEIFAKHYSVQRGSGLSFSASGGGYANALSAALAEAIGELLADIGRLPDTLYAQSPIAVPDTLVPFPGPATSQVSDRQNRLEPGARVRISNSSLGRAPVVGRVLAVLGDTLRLERQDIPGAPTRVLLDDRAKVELSVSHHNYLGRGILIGGATGGLIGGMVVQFRQMSNDFGEALAGAFGAQPPHHEVSSAPFYIGVAGGGLLGGFIGSTMTWDKWAPVSLRRRVSFGGSFEPTGRFRLAASVSLLPADVPELSRARSE
jgi:hypothetical protein